MPVPRSAASRASAHFAIVSEARLIEAKPVFAAVDEIMPAPWGPFGKEGTLDVQPLGYALEEFYRTDPISRASPTMAACVEAHREAAANGRKTGTHG